MTSDDDKVLPQCAANMAVLKTTGESFNTALGRLENDYRETRRIVDKNTVVVESMKELLEKDVVKVIKDIPSVIDGKIAYHEEKDPIHSAARKAHRDDITQTFSHPKSVSIPPENALRAKRERMKIRLIQAGIGFLIAATSVISTYAATN